MRRFGKKGKGIRCAAIIAAACLCVSLFAGTDGGVTGSVARGDKDRGDAAADDLREVSAPGSGIAADDTREMSAPDSDAAANDLREMSAPGGGITGDDPRDPAAGGSDAAAGNPHVSSGGAASADPMACSLPGGNTGVSLATFHASAAPAAPNDPPAQTASENALSADSQITQEGAAPEDYDGYIFKLNEGVAENRYMAFSADSSIEDVAFADDLYTADSVDDIFENFQAAEIEYIEPNYTVELFDSDAKSAENPNDRYYQSGDQWNLDVLNVGSVWEYGLEGQSVCDDGDVVVALIDSGINKSHEDIDESHVLDGYSYVTSDTSNTNDTMGHGTFCSGEIMATKDNEVGIAGISPEVYLMPLRVFGSSSSAYTSDVVSAISYATKAGNVDVISMSLGGEASTTSMMNACQEAANEGILVVAAAGNDGNTTLNYPAAYDCVVGVGSVGTDASHEEVSDFSQRGTENVFCVAPGYRIVSAYYGSSDSYYRGSGTSFSTPEVAALGAVLKSVDRTITQDDLKNILIGTSKDLGASGRDSDYGYGLVDFKAAVDSLIGSAEGTSAVTVNVENEAGDAVPDANVKICSYDSGEQVYPGADGVYTLERGRYTYEVSAEKYETATGVFSVIGESRTLTITLEGLPYEVNIHPRNTAGELLEDAEVTVKNSAGTTLPPDSDGIYRLKTGNYTYSVSCAGYFAQTGSFSVGEEALSLDVILYGDADVASVRFTILNEDENVISDAALTIRDGAGDEQEVYEDGYYKLYPGNYTYTLESDSYMTETGSLEITQAQKGTTAEQALYMRNPILWVYFEVVPIYAQVVVTDSGGEVAEPRSPGEYKLMKGDYHYTVTAADYRTVEGDLHLTTAGQTITIDMERSDAEGYVNVIYVSNGGSAVESQSVKLGDMLTSPEDPTREGYVFGGWYKEPSLTTPWDFDVDRVTQSTFLYAKWIPATWDVTYMFDGTRLEGLEPSAHTYGFAERELPVPQIEGWRFMYWCGDPELAQRVDYISPAAVGEVTLYAYCEADSGSYTVDFDSNGGSEVASQTVTKEDGYLAQKPDDPTREGYVFDGWYSDADLSIPWDFASDTVDWDMTLYAGWTPATYSITYISDGRVLTGLEPTEYTYMQAVSELPVPESTEGKVFDGWYSDEALTARVRSIPAGQLGDLTLYAKWKDKDDGDDCDYEPDANGHYPETDAEGYTLIYSQDELAALSEYVYDSTTARNMKNEGTIPKFRLARSIALTGEWTPIGMSDYFVGEFDGAGHTISNLSVNGSGNNASLFGKMYYASVSNLKVTGAVLGRTYTAGVGAECYVSDFSNLTVDVSVEGSGTSIGGIVASLKGGSITHCASYGSVTCSGTISYPTAIYATGGILGDTDSSSGVLTIEGCVNYGEVKNASGTPTGGIAGYLYGGTSTEVADCYNCGGVSQTSDSTDALFGMSAGIVGLSRGAASIHNCYNAGTVQSDKVTSNNKNYVAGVAFYQTTSANADACYYLENTACSEEGTNGPAIGRVEVESSIDYCWYYNTYYPDNVYGGPFSYENSGDYSALIAALGEGFAADADGSINGGLPALAWQTQSTFLVGFTPKDSITGEVVGDAIVSVDGEAIDGLSARLPVGLHRYTIERDGYDAVSSILYVGQTDQERTVLMEPEYYELTFTVTPADAELTVRNDILGAVDPVSTETDGSDSAVYTYSLPSGLLYGEYSYTASKYGYETVSGKIPVTGPDSIDIRLTASDYHTLIFDTTPSDAVVTVRDAGGNVIDPFSDKVYHLTAGDYTYTVKADGYRAVSGSFTAEGDDTIRITLQEYDSWQGDSDTDWYDESETTYYLSNADEFAGFRDLCNGGNTFSGKTIVLKRDMDLNNLAWTPIGKYNYNGNTDFCGTFDGDGHTIKNLNVNQSTTSYTGLFNSVYSATIKNLTVEGFVSGREYTGGIAGYARNTDFENCANNADVETSYYQAGGIVGCVGGSNSTSSSFTRCVNTGDVTATSTKYTGTNSYALGGIAGAISNNNSTIEYCANRGKISGTIQSAGGIAGYMGNTSGTSTPSVSYCYNTGEVENTYTGGYAGGIVGRVYGSSVTATIDSCLQYGGIIKADSYAGGIVGYSTGATSSSGSRAKATNCWYSYESAACGNPSAEDAEGEMQPFGSAEDPGYADVVASLGENYTIDPRTGLPALSWEIDSSLYTVTFSVDYDTEANLSDLYDVSYIVRSDPGDGGIAEEYPVTNGSAQLPSGNYTYVVSRTGYGDVAGSFSVNAEQVTVPVTLQAIRYTLTLNYTPADAAVELTDIDGNERAPSQQGDGRAEFALTNGTYVYTVSSYGYEDAEGTVTIDFSDQETTVDLVELDEYKISFEVVPSQGAFSDTPTVALYQGNDLIDTVEAQATVTLASGDYTYVARASGYKITTGGFSVTADDTVTITMDPKDAGNTDADTWWYTDDPSATEFTIGTPEELRGLAELVNEGTETFAAKTITLDSDISMSDAVWTPIGEWDDYSFSGTFDGDGHSITIANGEMSGSEYGFGLFGHVENAQIENLIMRGNINVTHTSSLTDSVVIYVGGLAGHAENTTVSRVSDQMTIAVDATIGGSGVLDIGGLIGWAGGGVTMESCCNIGSVTASIESRGIAGSTAISQAGGLIGFAYSSSYDPAVIRNCYNTGGISAASDYMVSAAGIVGAANTSQNSFVMQNCYNAGLITATAPAGDAAALCGSAISGVTTNNYYLAGSADSDFGIERTDEELRSQAAADALGDAYRYVDGMWPLLKWEKVITELEVANQPDKTEYSDMEDFDDTGMTLRATYDDGSGEVVASGWSVSDGTDLRVNREGAVPLTESSASVPVTVSFRDASVRVFVTVTQKTHNIPDEDLVLDIPAPEAGRRAEPIEIETDKFSATVSWTQAGEAFTGEFAENTYYRAYVELHTKYQAGDVWYTLPLDASVSADGMLEQRGRTVSRMRETDNRYTCLTASLTYPATGAHSPSFTDQSLHLYYEGDPTASADHAALLEKTLWLSNGTDEVSYTVRDLEMMALEGKAVEAAYSTYDGTSRDEATVTGISLYNLCGESGLFPDNLSDESKVIIGENEYTWGQVRMTANAYSAGGEQSAQSLPFLLAFGADGRPYTTTGPLEAIRPMTSADDETSFTENVSSVALSDNPTYASQHSVTFHVSANDRADLSGILSITVKDSYGNELRPASDGVYLLTEGEEYAFSVSAENYATQTGSIEPLGGDGNIQITLIRSWTGEVSEPELGADGYYLIYTPEELMWFNRNAGQGTNARLMADITLNNDGETLNSWQPMFTSETGTGYYMGTFDGNGHTIKNLYMYRENKYPLEVTSDGGVVLHNDRISVLGMFGYLSGTVKDLAVTGTIEVLDRPDQSMGDWFMLGGIAGYMASDALISGCSTDIAMVYNVGQEDTYTGGYPDRGWPEACDTFVGGITASISNGTVENCYSTGDIFAAGTRSIRAGGIAGALRSANTLVQYCYSSANIAIEPGADAATDFVSGMGSIVGYTMGITTSTSGTVQYCFGLSDRLDGVNGLRSSANRVVGAEEASATLQYNYGNAAMEIVNVASHDGTDNSRQSVNGAEMDLSRAKESLNPYTALGWSPQIWKSDSTDTLPTFVWQAGRALVVTYGISIELPDGVSLTFTGGAESSDGNLTATNTSASTFTTTDASTVSFTLDVVDASEYEVTCEGGSLASAGGYYSISDITGPLTIRVVPR